MGLSVICLLFLVVMSFNLCNILRTFWECLESNPGCWVQSENPIHCAMQPPFTSKGHWCFLPLAVLIYACYQLAFLKYLHTSELEKVDRYSSSLIFSHRSEIPMFTISLDRCLYGLPPYFKTKELLR